MKKFLVMIATLVMSLSFTVGVMANSSPDIKDKTTAETRKEDDNYSKTSPKTGDSSAPAALIYAALGAAAMSVYAAKRIKEQH
ncbi:MULTISPECIES: hypothetical protein [Anaerostipes]|uniref:hypothetical protein n=1 Tax=Anaerostipes TaxID=207244 RepID=UPI00095204C0|nr:MULTISPECIES: hypothetical protein [Anaerostipes]MCI5624022.1 hypothetical protein [Anaerostipes sp.]MDY2726941.1 hypothetical protein [Anaerostipes faecalis]OLR59174.1 hypothetical protein BHF70_05775 [Anaerostipes sp. 494a]